MDFLLLRIRAGMEEKLHGAESLKIRLNLHYSVVNMLILCCVLIITYLASEVDDFQAVL